MSNIIQLFKDQFSLAIAKAYKNTYPLSSLKKKYRPMYYSILN